MKTVLVFQGGGALGAFGAAAWAELAPRLPASDPLIAVAGASVGAFNAATVARHHDQPDRGAAALQALWQRWATPSVPFFGAWPLPLPPSGADTAAWNGFLTGLLVGSPAVFTALHGRWNPLAGFSRITQPLHDRQGMWRLAEELAGHGSQRPADAEGRQPPMLAVAAVDVMSGHLALFDSDRAPIGAEHLCASSAVPIEFEPVAVDGRLHSDGEVTRDTLLPPLLARLLETGRITAGEPLQLITMEQFPQPLAAVPSSTVELVWRGISLAQRGKLDAPVIDGIHIARHLRVQRDALPEDGVSGQFDYSPARLARLAEQGREAAARAWDQATAGDEAALPADSADREPVLLLTTSQRSAVEA